MAPRASSPAVLSSWTMAGTPRRVRSTRNRWTALANAAVRSGRSPVPPLTRVTCPVPWRSCVAAFASENQVSSASRDIQTPPSCASFSGSVMRPRRSSTRESTGRLGSRYAAPSSTAAVIPAEPTRDAAPVTHETAA